MSTNTFIKNALHIEKDPKGKKITIKRDFDATPDLVWRAWTESELLEQWWAPKPYRVETKHMDFKVGGYWFYAMVAPDDSKHYARANYTAIEPIKRFEAYDSFVMKKEIRLISRQACRGKMNSKRQMPGHR